MIKWILGFVLLTLAGTLNAQAENDYAIVLLKDGATDFNQADKQTALQFWINDLGAEVGLNLKIQAVDSVEEMSKMFESQPVLAVILNTDKLMSRFPQLAPLFNDELFALKRQSDLYENFIIVVRNDSGLNSLAQLTHKSISSVDNYLVLNRYLSYLTWQQAKTSPADYFAQIVYSKTASRAVLDVYFGKSRAAIVPGYIFATATDLNPALRRDLKVIHDSGPKFIPGLGLTLRRTSQEVNQRFNHAMVNHQNTTRGKELLQLFQVEGFEKINFSALNPMSFMYD